MWCGESQSMILLTFNIDGDGDDGGDGGDGDGGDDGVVVVVV